MLTVKNIMGRFRLEPRADYLRRQPWLVAYDVVKEKYVKKAGERSFMRFKNSLQAYDILARLVKKGEI